MGFAEAESSREADKPGDVSLLEHYLEWKLLKEQQKA